VFVAHYALGQARLGAPFSMLRAAVRNCWQSARAIWRRRPDIVITTGAGSMLFTVLWARILGARIVLIDSFARFHAPSAFARLAGPLAHVRIAQSAESAKHWKGALTFDPFRYLEQDHKAKQPLLFATVGATLPFDRLVALVAGAAREGLIPERIIIQTGKGGIKPDLGPDCPQGRLEVHETLPFDQMKKILDEADIVVCHGGTGSLITAMRAGCRIIAVARRFDRGEHYDDHQSEITGAFEERGLIATADTPEEFGQALKRVRAATPRAATTDLSELNEWLKHYIAEL
jgi:UDP-N-acetylglucosamine--N-acetylmuramyl-(pentapeptide) pyrophosphoryl-undecaprenol N-acetylglucosamine transferase